jgi:hypothetical protein
MKLKLKDADLEITEDFLNKSSVLRDLVKIARKGDESIPVPMDIVNFKTLMNPGLPSLLKGLPLGNLRSLVRGADYLEMELEHRVILQEIAERFNKNKETVMYFLKNELMYYDWSIIIEELMNKDVSLVSEICGMDYFSEMCGGDIAKNFKKKLLKDFGEIFSKIDKNYSIYYSPEEFNKDLKEYEILIEEFTFKDLILSILILDFFVNERDSMAKEPLVIYLMVMPRASMTLILELLSNMMSLIDLFNLFSKAAMHIDNHDSEKIFITQKLIEIMKRKKREPKSSYPSLFKRSIEDTRYIEKIKAKKMYLKGSETKLAPLEFVQMINPLIKRSFYISHFYQILDNIIPVTMGPINYDNSLGRLINFK